MWGLRSPMAAVEAGEAEEAGVDHQGRLHHSGLVVADQPTVVAPSITAA